MAMNIYEAIVNGDSRRVQAKGEITLPKAWRDAKGIEPGDDVALHETDDGTLEIIPPSE